MAIQALDYLLEREWMLGHFLDSMVAQMDSQNKLKLFPEPADIYMKAMMNTSALAALNNIDKRFYERMKNVADDPEKFTSAAEII